jgi:predicted nuclease of predicted toxin-antitoxin system
MRSAGHDVVYGAERTEDPGDRALLAEAHAGGRILLTKDHDLGALVHRDDLPHFGVMLIDDLGDPAAEVRLILSALLSHAGRLAEGAFLRVTPSGVRESQASPSSQGNVFHVAACFAVAAGEAESIYHDDHSYR